MTSTCATRPRTSEVDPILLFDGGDHEEWDQATYAGLMQYAGQGNDDFEVLHTSLDAYLAEVLPQAGRIGPWWKASGAEPGRDFDDQQWLIPGVASSRCPDQAGQRRVRDAALPVGRAVQRPGAPGIGRNPPQGFLNVAWKSLLQNHPHDSICGCSIDLVHEDMKYRFSQSCQISDRLTRGHAAACRQHCG